MSLMVSFVLSLFSRDISNEIWDLIGSVSEGFLTYLPFENLIFSMSHTCSSKIINVMLFNFKNILKTIGLACHVRGL